jgi:signal transduction histidine kinase
VRVSTRLYLAIVPAVLGVLLVAALAYWGERGRQAPGVLVAVAVVAAVTSLVISWRNTRYVAQRVTHLATRAAHTDSPRGSATLEGGRHPGPSRAALADELDEIESTVQELGSEIVAERSAAEQHVRDAEARAAEYEALLDRAVTSMTTRIQEVHLPLHILLASPFGTLNENQEEMLGAAEAAVDAADAELRLLRKLLDVDRGAAALAPQRISVAELLRPSLAIAEDRGVAGVVRVTAELPDTLPRVVLDPVHTQEALTALLSDVVRRAAPGSGVVLRAEERDERSVVVRMAPLMGDADDPLEVRLARRVLEQEGALAQDREGSRLVRLPAETLSRG